MSSSYRLASALACVLLTATSATAYASPQQAAPTAPAAATPPQNSITKDLKSLPLADQKRFAAGRFLGFYTLNGRTTGDVCRAEGVDLTAYVQAFQRKHDAEYERADKIMAASGFSTAEMAAATDANRGRLEENVRQSMRDLAGALHKTTVAEGCAYIAAHVSDAVAGQSFAQQNPEIEAVLMSN
jgi:hypothetical protein